MRIRYPQFHHAFATLLVLLAAVFLWRTALALSAGATPDKSNNPRMVGGVVQPPETCSKSGCHDTQPTTGCNGKVEITGLPGCYVAGQTYNLTIKVTDANARRWGFEVGAQYTEGNQWDYVSAGSIDNVAGQRTKKVTSADGQRSFITHNSGPNSPNGDGTFAGQAGSAQWNFTWTAPGGTARQTQVCFYVAGLAGNNDQTSDGDCTYNTKVCVQPCGPVETRHSTWGEVKVRYEK
jgi:hypothetical protein